MTGTKYNVVVSIVNYNCVQDIEETVNSYMSSLADSNLLFIIVNNFYDTDSLINIRQLCENRSFLLIESENKGYGYANNLAFTYAKENVVFDFFIVSNPDIHLKSISKMFDYKDTCSIIAPSIVTANGIKQNPFIAYRLNIILWLWKIKHLNNSLLFWFLASIATKAINRFARLHKRCKIYAPHGAFFILTYSAIKKISFIFDNEIFLFGEEFIIGEVAFRLNIPVVYESDILIEHKCHVSTMKIGNRIQSKYSQDSYSLYYRKYLKSKSIKNVD